MSKQCLDVHQMQHLQELGLELDYDTLYSYVKFEDTDWLLKPFSDLNIIGISCRYIPAYTLQDVLDALPKSVISNGRYYFLTVDFDDENIYYGTNFGIDLLKGIIYRKQGCLIDAAYEMLCWCIENGYAKIVKEDK